MKVIIAASYPKKFKIASWIIAKYQGTNFSHVLVIYKDWVYEASHGDVHAIPFAEWDDNNNILFVFETTEDKVDLPYLKRMVETRTKYGKLQIISIALKYLFNIVLRDNGNKRLICSEYVGKFLKLDWVNDLTTPEEIVDYLKGLK